MNMLMDQKLERGELLEFDELVDGSKVTARKHEIIDGEVPDGSKVGPR